MKNITSVSLPVFVTFIFRIGNVSFFMRSVSSSTSSNSVSLCCCFVTYDISHWRRLVLNPADLCQTSDVSKTVPGSMLGNSETDVTHLLSESIRWNCGSLCCKLGVKSCQSGPCVQRSALTLIIFINDMEIPFPFSQHGDREWKI